VAAMVWASSYSRFVLAAVSKVPLRLAEDASLTLSQESPLFFCADPYDYTRPDPARQREKL